MTKKLIYISSILLVIALISIGIGLGIARADDSAAAVEVSQEVEHPGVVLNPAHVLLQKNVLNASLLEDELLLTLETDLSATALLDRQLGDDVQLDSAAVLEGRSLNLLGGNLLQNAELDVNDVTLGGLFV